ncbi:MAG: FliM/FliN family flagellar motor switch protein [Pseudoruegeria sp.]
MDSTTNRAKTIDDLPVKISIELDRIQISIQDLSELASGKVLQFSDKAPDKVRVFANSRYFADATLIMVEDKIAIRIDQVVQS